MAGKPHPRQRVDQPQDQSIRYIALTQNKVAIVDTEDYERLNKHTWYAYWSPNARTYYAGRIDPSCRGHRIKMHQQVLSLPEGLEPDHENHDGLDNRKVNLRPSTSAQNKSHRRKFRNSKSRFKGVHKVEGGYIARIQYEKKRLYLGYFSNEEDAARSYDAKAMQLHGKFAVLNFPAAHELHGEFARFA